MSQNRRVSLEYAPDEVIVRAPPNADIDEDTALEIVSLLDDESLERLAEDLKKELAMRLRIN
jgi:hypothetical protein